MTTLGPCPDVEQKSLDTTGGAPPKRIDCPLCGGRRFNELFVKCGQHFVRCRRCSLVLINPRPEHGDLVAVYAHGYSARYVRKSAAKLRRARRRVRQMRRYAAGGRWLDIGCSAGFVLAAAREAGYTPYGSDVDPSGLEHAREQLGICNLHAGPFEDAGYASGFFQVVTLYDVLEHLPDLNRTLAELRRVLAADGVAEIWTPDLGHWRRPRPLESWSAVMPSKHLYYFDRHTLGELLGKHGLQVVKRRRTLKPGLRVYVRPRGS